MYDPEHSSAVNFGFTHHRTRCLLFSACCNEGTNHAVTSIQRDMSSLKHLILIRRRLLRNFEGYRSIDSVRMHKSAVVMLELETFRYLLVPIQISRSHRVGKRG